MGKESRQHIIFLVVVLGAVVAIDMGNSQLSGRFVDQTIAGEEIVLGGETEDLDSSAYSTTTIGGGSEQPLRMQPPIAERICELQDMTAYVTKHLPPNQQIALISDLDDLQKRLFIVHTFDSVLGNTHLYVFDLNQDLIFSGDDRIHYIDTLQQVIRLSYAPFEITRDVTGNEKLFWQKPTIATDETWSCDLPRCTNKNQVAVTNAQSNTIVKIIPSLTYNRLFMASVDTQTMTTMIIRSCSLTSAPDGCSQTEDKYVTHTTNTGLYITNSIRDQGIMMTDFTRGHFFNIHTKKMVQVPTGIQIDGAIGNFIGPNMLALINLNIIGGGWMTELVFLDLIGLQTFTIDRLPNNVYAFFIDTYPLGNIYAIYQKLGYWRKDVGQQPKLILEDKNINVRPLMQLANGNIIGATANGIVSFTCTP